MLLEAAQQGSLEEVLTVASALSVQDPRERPVGGSRPPTRRTRNGRIRIPTSPR